MTDIQDQNGQGNSNDSGAQDDEDAQGAASPDIKPSTPEDRIAALQAERDDIKDRMLRIAADFENWKKRARKEQTDGEARVREQVLKDILDVVDNLERATSAYSDKAGADKAGAIDGKAILTGVNLVLRLFNSKLERYGVKPFDAKGEPFDPHIHEAISHVPSAEVPPGHVANELQKGYRIGDKLLRPAIVAVAAGSKEQGSA